MSTKTVGERASHRRSLLVVTLTTLSGIAAALVSAIIASGATDPTGLYPLAGAIFLQLPVLRLLGVDIEEFGLKDNLYVAFMTFALWFVAWTILLTTGASL